MVNQLDTYFTGAILHIGFGGPPSGWERCEGQRWQVRDKVALASIMGVSDQKEFSLPDLTRDTATPAGLTPIINLSGRFPGLPSPVGAVPASSEVPALTGQILYVVARRASDGWAVCDGSLLPINKYWPLFSLLGTRFGGDGQSNFALPNLVGAPTTPKGLLPLICVNGVHPQEGGEQDGMPQIDAYFGQVIYLAFETGAEGWRRCDGAILPKSQYPFLFYVLGNRFGGDGRNNFALPNLTNAASTPPGLIPVIAMDGIYPS